jgi:hypothetical protein
VPGLLLAVDLAQSTHVPPGELGASAPELST